MLPLKVHRLLRAASVALLLAPMPAHADGEAPAKASAPSREPGTNHAPGAALGATGGALFVTGLVLLIYGNASNAGSGSAATIDDRERTLANDKTFNTVGAALMGAGGAIGIVSVIVAMIPGVEKAKTARSLWIAPSLNGVQAGGSF